MAKAIKKIKQAISHDGTDADNWIVWGLILRTVGSYAAAKHKFQQSLRLDPMNEAALFEMNMLERILELDSQISLDQVPAMRRLRAIETG